MSKKPSQLRRKNKAKTLRKARNAKMAELRKLVAHSREDANIVLMKGDDEIVLAVRRGLFGHDRSPIIRVPHEDLVGAVEDKVQLGNICTKLGVMVLAQLVGHHLSYGADELANAVAKWAGIDLAQLAKEAADGAAETGTDGGGAPGIPASDAATDAELGGSPGRSEEPSYPSSPIEYRPENEGV